VTPPVFPYNLTISLIPTGILLITPANIISDTPLPIPFSVIISPSQYKTYVPAIRVKIIVA